jgi:hypothetical protein
MLPPGTFLWWVSYGLMMHHHIPKDKNCLSAHERVKAAAQELDNRHREKEEIDREARHKARNVRMLMEAVLTRLERRNES